MDEQLKKLPDEINWKIFSFFRHKNASILIEAFWLNKLNLKHIYLPKLSHLIWNELSPSHLERNVYGSNMYIIRTKMLQTEKILLSS